MNTTITTSLLSIFCAVATSTADVNKGSDSTGIITPSTRPNADQAVMIQRGYGMFIHFGINTFSGKEWTDGTLKPEIYNPTQLDTDQWAKTAKDAGMRYVILITKHHDGFCLWDSPETSYDVGSSPVKTDVVKSMAASCKKYGIKLGLYYSLWDRNWGNGIMRQKTKLTKAQSDAYVSYMKKQLTELLTNYGDVCELWFDGGWMLPRENWQIENVYAHVKKLQPHCLVGVNWSIGKVGNPDFHAVRPKMYKKGQPIRYFPSDFRLGDPMLPEFPDVKLFSGPDKKLYYLPFETTVCLNKHWFWQPYDKGLRSVQELLPLYERSTAQDNVLILNSPPNRKGVMDQRNVERLKELALALGAKPGKPIPTNLAKSAKATSNSVWKNNTQRYGATMAIDGNPATRWAAAKKQSSITLQWKQPTPISFLRVREYEEDGTFRVQAFTIDAKIAGQWKTIHTGTTIGANQLIRFTTVSPTALRLNITQSSTSPSLWHLAVGCE
jgi:alpha-L-fucosidase